MVSSSPQTISQFLASVPSAAWVLGTGAVAAAFSFLGLIVTAIIAVITNALNTRQSLLTEADGRFDKALQNLYEKEARVRSGSAYILANMAVHGTAKEKRYFATTLSSLCNVVRFDRDIYFIDAAFTELLVLYRKASRTERANLDALKDATVKALALHIAEYEVAIGQSEKSHYEAIYAVTPEAETLMKRDDFQKLFHDELQFAKLIKTFDAELQAAKSIEGSLSEEARRDELKVQRDELKDRLWSIRIDGLLLSHISRIVENS
jgi:hypothetical protein